MLKKNAREIVVAILGWQVRRLRRKHSFKVIAVAGSIGKTSTKFALAAVLKQQFKVRYQAGNYNDLVTVPLIFFGLPEPSLMNPFAWLRTFLLIEKQLRGDYPYDIVLVELGPDGPGQMIKFDKYLHTDIGVLTAIQPEHMEFFDDIDAVAREELVLAQLSDSMIVNADLCDERYLSELQSPVTYGMNKSAIYQVTNVNAGANGFEFNIKHKGAVLLSGQHESFTTPQLYSACAAVAVANELGVTPKLIGEGIQTVQPVPGRMNRLMGIQGATIIDDTYNSSPIAAKAALDTLYRLQAEQKIAILGNMNELGTYSAAAHTEIGEYCDPTKLDLVVTIGPDANKFLAAAAEKRGCQAQRFTDPYAAGEFVKGVLRQNALVLAKGSQNGVFAEEAVKLLLADPKDSAKLVRQNSDWLTKKRTLFSERP